jgi:O-antigen ligase
MKSAEAETVTPQDIARKGGRSRERLATAAEGFLAWTVYAYLFLTYIRPQDIFPPLGAIHPGWPVTVLVLAACVPHVASQFAKSRAARVAFFFLAVLCVGLVATVNQYWWFQTTWIHVVTTMVFLVGVPVLLKNARYRMTILKIFMGSFWLLSVWVLTHHGTGYGAFLEDENDSAAWLGVGVCFGAFFGILGEGLQRRLMGWALVALSAAAIVATNSRGGFLGLAAGAVAVLWLSRRLVTGAIVVVALVALTYSFLPAGYVDKRLMSATDPNDPTRTERIYSWHRAWDMFLDHPIIGVGAGNFSWRVASYDATESAIQERKFRRSIAGRAAHSVYFQVLPETGLLGTASYLILVLGAIGIGTRARRKNISDGMDGFDRAMALAATSSLIALSASGAFVSILFYPHVWALCGMISYLPLKYPQLLQRARPVVSSR